MTRDTYKCMIELNLLALAFLPCRLLGLPHQVRAARTIPAEAEPLFAFLSNLENHWLLADRFIDVVRLEGPAGGHHSGEVQLRGPLGLRRRAKTRVRVSRRPRLMIGRAEVGRRTVAHISWRLTPHRGTTEVELTAVVESADLVDHLVLLLGGRRWLERRFAQTLAALAERAAMAAEALGGDAGRDRCESTTRRESPSSLASPTRGSRFEDLDRTGLQAACA